MSKLILKPIFMHRTSFLKPANGFSFFSLMAIFFFGFWMPLFCLAQQTGAVRELLPNTPINRGAEVGETHIYKITLAAGNYARLVITADDIDVQVRLFAPDSSNEVGVHNDPTENGIRLISLITETSGDYRLEIRASEQEAKSGHYQVKLEELRPATAQDQARLAAEKVELEGALLLDYVNTAEQKQQGMVKYLEALTLWRQLGDRKSELRVLSTFAAKKRENGEPQIAQEYAGQAIQLARELGNRYEEANMMVTFGQIYRSLGENQKAIDSFYQAKQLFKSLSAKFGEALTMSQIGGTFVALGEWQEGLRYLNEALPTVSSLGDRYTEASILDTMGICYRRLGDTQKGIELHSRALAISHQNQTTSVETYSLIHLGSGYLELGDKQKALDFSEQGVKLSRALGDPLGEGDSLILVGNIAYLLGDYQKALDVLTRSLHLYQSLWERNREAKALHSLAQVNTALGNFEEARKQIEQTIEIQESLRANVLSQQLRENIFASAQTSFALYIDLLQQLHKKNPTAGFAAKALEVSERARARSLLDLLAESRADIREGVPQNLLGLERSLQQQLNAKAAARTRLLSDKRNQAQAASFDKEISQLSVHFQEIEAQIRQSSPRYAALTQPQPLAAAEIQQQLDDQTVLLEFALGDKQSWLWAVTSSNIASYQLPASREIEATARQMNEWLTARQPRRGESEAQYQTRISEADGQLQSVSKKLSQLLFGQVAGKMSGDWKGKRLAVVASGSLEYIPFAALPVPATDYRPLIVDHEIINLPSASVLAVLRKETAGRKSAEKNIAIIADPVFEPSDPRVLNALRKDAPHNLIASVRSGDESSDAPESPAPSPLQLSLRSFTPINERGGFSRLPFSREEADAIASLAPKNSFIKATDFLAARSFATGGDLARFRILHFATHGLLNSERPELSGLVLSLVDEQGKSQDGFLRMHEIYNLNLPADLIVLSACQTALGKQIKGEGLVGLTRGFMYAGAQRVVASLWQVDDLATAELMKRFYRAMLKEGMRPAQALRVAQLEMMKQGRWSSPYFWAAFTIQGEWK